MKTGGAAEASLKGPFCWILQEFLTSEECFRSLLRFFNRIKEFSTLADKRAGR
jgi:hypothetical protein